MQSYAICLGTVLESLAQFPDNSFDAILTDPPYGLGNRQPTPGEIVAYLQGSELSTGGDFMGKEWSVPSIATWKALFRVLKPGGAVLCCGGPRMFDLVTVGMRMAGFEVRDSLCWLYAKGFPKSLNVSKALDKDTGTVRPVIGQQTLTGNAAVSLKEKGGTYGIQCLPRKGVCQHCGKNAPYTDWTICEACLEKGLKQTLRSVSVDVTGPGSAEAEQWDGYGTALKPGWEPVILARKPLEGTVVENVRRWGVGALNIDGCRLSDAPRTTHARGNVEGAKNGPVCFTSNEGYETPGASGRWPANVALDEEAGAILDEQTGPRKSGLAVRENGGGGQIFSGVGDNPYVPKPKLPNIGYMDGKTNTSRFFFSSKVATKERERGCESLPLASAGEMTNREEDTDGLESPRAGAGRTGGARNHHPTLKPISLAKWLATLILPPTEDACLLVPYSGAGSEVIGALQAGWPMVIGIEMEPRYVEIAHARIASWVPDAIVDA